MVVFSKLLGRDGRVVIKLLDATILTVHAEVAGSVAFLGVHRGSVITGYSVYTSVSASDFPWDIRLEQGHRVSEKIH